MKKIGLAFAGGGFKGGYQIGAYYAFKKCHIKISGVVGTSIGAVNAAAIASGNAEKLLQYWSTAKPEKILKLDEEIEELLVDKKVNQRTLTSLKENIKKITNNKGLPTEGIKETISNLVDYNKLKNSKMDFGFATVKLHPLTAVYKTKENIKENELIDYLLASCSLPVFRLDKMLEDSKYIDGGFYDNCPSTILNKKGYDLIYEIHIKGIGIDHLNHFKDTKVIKLQPSRNICKILDFDQQKIQENIKMGYYDTLRYLKGYEGKKYVFHKIRDFQYKYYMKNLKPNFIRRNHIIDKDSLVEAIEQQMEKEKYYYYKVYRMGTVLKKLKLTKNS